jgi:hypothetical protein
MHYLSSHQKRGTNPKRHSTGQPINQSKENQKTIASKPKGQSAAVDLMTVARRERAPSLQGRNHGGSLKQPPHTGPCTTLSLTKNGEQTTSDIQPVNRSTNQPIKRKPKTIASKPKGQSAAVALLKLSPKPTQNKPQARMNQSSNQKQTKKNSH